MTDEELEWPSLKEGESELTESGELIWRQVHPHRLHDGVVSSEAFEPGRSDDKQLSSTRQAKTTAEQAYKHHAEVAKLKTAGSTAVTVSEVRSQKPIIDGDPDVASLRVVDDSETSSEDAPLPPGHVYIDYRPLGSKRITKKAKQLAFFANKRGGIVSPISDEQSV